MSKRKAPSENNPNSVFCEFLLELANFEKNVSRNIYKYNAYRKAASVIAAHPTKLQSGEEAKKLQGVGDKIAKKLNEFIQTGKLKKIENIHNDEDSVAISLLTRISGIGPAKAKELVGYGIKNLDDLKLHRTYLNHHQLIGLKYFSDFEKPIPRSEIMEIENQLKEKILQLDSQYKITVCGSYRRGKSSCGDIDILLTHPSYITAEKTKIDNLSLQNVICCLEKANIIIETLSLGQNKFMGVCKLNNSIPRRLDIRYVPNDQYYCAILYFTGSDIFNKTMRAHALEKSFTLNEYCLRPVGSTGITGEPVTITCEEDIFDYINFPFKKPEDRNM